MSNNAMWILFFIALWAGSCWYVYSMGWMHGNTAANVKAAQHFQPPQHP